MEYRLTVQHNKNDNEQSVTIINDREDAKTEYLKSCEKIILRNQSSADAESGKESCFKQNKGNMEKELDYVVNYVLN